MTSDDNRNLSRTRGILRVRLVALMAVATVAIALGAIWIRRPPSDVRALLAELPAPDLADLEPQVAAKLDSLRRAVKENPRDGDAWGRLAMGFDVHNMSEEAVRCYAQAAELDSVDVRWPYLGAVVLRALRPAEAPEWFERAAALSPNSAPLLVNYGRALSDVGRLDEAAEVFRRAAAADARVSQVYHGLARVALARGDVDSSM